MSDYLGTLLARQVQPQLAVQPRPLFRFEPAAPLPWTAAPVAGDPGLAVETEQEPLASPPPPVASAALRSPPTPTARSDVRGAEPAPAAGESGGAVARSAVPRIEARPTSRPPRPQLLPPTPEVAPAMPSIPPETAKAEPWPAPGKDGRPSIQPARAAAEATPAPPLPRFAPDAPVPPAAPTIVREIVRERRLQPLPQETVIEREVIHRHDDSAPRQPRVQPAPSPALTTAHPETHPAATAPSRPAAPDPAPAAEQAPPEASARQTPVATPAIVTRRRVQPQVRAAPLPDRPQAIPVREPPSVNVSIGRIEVRVTKAPAQPAPPPPQPRARSAESSLADYLKQRANGEY